LVDGYRFVNQNIGDTLFKTNQIWKKMIFLGCVIESCEIKLVDWIEGNYKVSDKPNSRGV
jgi:hypothetical protein